ncbi:LINE-1 retrotransposable element ORF2 protein, partial [Lucilia cuprina]
LGVKQRCILSPILFALYLNDLADALPNGVKVENFTVKVLLYADDIFIISDSPAGLQNMINSLHTYCNLWHLKVNMAKSKFLIFRNGTRISNNLLWTYDNRLPHKIAKIIIDKQTYWADEWSNLCLKINLLPTNVSTPISSYCKTIIPLLNYFLLDISSSNLSSHTTSLLVRARGGLLDINARSFRSNTLGLCTICNMDATENTFHFLFSRDLD